MEDSPTQGNDLGSEVRKVTVRVLHEIHSAWSRQQEWESSDGLPAPAGHKKVDVPISSIRDWLRRNDYFDDETLENALWVLWRLGFLLPIYKDARDGDVIFYIEGLRDSEGDLVKETHFIVKTVEDFEARYEHDSGLWKTNRIPVASSLNKEGQNKEERPKPTLSFDSKKSEITFHGKVCRIPLSSNQNQVCLHLFGLPFGEKLQENDVIDNFYRGSKSQRSFYDAVRAINSKVAAELGIPRLIEYEASQIWIRIDNAK